VRPPPSTRLGHRDSDVSSSKKSSEVFDLPELLVLERRFGRVHLEVGAQHPEPVEAGIGLGLVPVDVEVRSASRSAASVRARSSLKQTM